MPEISHAAWLSAVLASNLCGLGWFALSLPVHWQQVRGTPGPGPRATVALRLLGSLGLAAAFAFGLRADHPSMAVLVWVMTLAAAALAIAFVLAWRPRWLGWLAPGALRSGR